MLLVVVVGFALLYLLPQLGLCSRVSLEGIACSDPVSNVLAEFAMVIVITSLFTGLPPLVALIGAIILVHRLVRKRQRANDDHLT